MRIQCFPAEKELLGTLLEGLPPECGHSGVGPHTPSLGMERWTIPGYGAQSLEGQRTVQVSIPHSTDTHFMAPS